MKKEFWDVKTHASVQAEVKEAVQFENGRWAFKAQTKDGRSLTRFVSAADVEAFKKDGGKVAKKAACKKCCKK